MAKSSFKDIINTETPVLIDFYAEWCGPCKTFAPIIDELKSEIGDQARIIKIDIDKNQALASKLNVKSIPTVMIYQNGEVMYHALGSQTKKTLKNEIEKLVKPGSKN